jgi:Zn-dependent M28 family amino/carboxypeptidase
MPLPFAARLLSLATAAAVIAAAPPPDEGGRWWTHVQALASDEMRGRETGSPEHRKAAEYVAAQFRAAGLEPAGTDGFFQPVAFRVRRYVETESRLELVRGGTREPIVLGEEALFSMRIEHAPQVEAPLVFVGYGLTIPETHHDDLAGIDLRGKVALYFMGGPKDTPGPLLAHYQSGAERWKSLQRAGAIGVVSIRNPHGQEIPWDRFKLARFKTAMELTQPELVDAAGQQLAVAFDTEHSARLFAGTGHDFKQLLADAVDGKPLPHFPVPAAIAAKVAFAVEARESDNVVGLLPGADPALAKEVVVLSAHLDHLGVGEPIDGDAIYNGAMDNASGVATLIETARALAQAKERPRRSVLFLAVTAEEKGLLGSRYYAAHPTVPREAIVADVNVDMFSPLFPLRSVIALGADESDLGDDLRRAGREATIEVLPDPEPEHNNFVRSDQYSFIRYGVPALTFRVGYKKDSPESQIVERWMKERYHAPSDDLAQPVDLRCAADFNRLYARVVREIANRAERPRWNADSFFRRFAPTAHGTP